ncbi:MAG: hypothetical protein FWG43_05085, partial [Clostridiales bacterium]|nr:hypothetical protein [Clostridiales bacterium]
MTKAMGQVYNTVSGNCITIRAGGIGFHMNTVSFNTIGWLKQQTSPMGYATKFYYDKCGRLAQVKDGSDTTNYVYYANDNLQTQTLPNGVTANYTYYGNNKLHTLQNEKGGNILEAYQYAYDVAGNMSVKQDVKGTTSYYYTPINQLASVAESSGKHTEYTYDASGNRQMKIITTPPASLAGTPLAGEGGEEYNVTTWYEVDEQNRLIYTEQNLNSDTITEQYFYDVAGNMLGRCPE